MFQPIERTAARLEYLKTLTDVQLKSILLACTSDVTRAEIQGELNRRTQEKS